MKETHYSAAACVSVRKATKKDLKNLPTIRHGLVLNGIKSFLDNKSIKLTPQAMKNLHKSIIEFITVFGSMKFKNQTEVKAVLEEMNLNTPENLAKYITNKDNNIRCKIIQTKRNILNAKKHKSGNNTLDTQNWDVQEVTQNEYAQAPDDKDFLFWRVRSKYGNFDCKLYKFIGNELTSTEQIGKAVRRTYAYMTGCNYHEVREIRASSWETLPEAKKYRTCFDDPEPNYVNVI